MGGVLKKEKEEKNDPPIWSQHHPDKYVFVIAGYQKRILSSINYTFARPVFGNDYESYHTLYIIQATDDFNDKLFIGLFM